MTVTRQPKQLVVEHSDGTQRVITHDGQGTWMKTEHITPQQEQQTGKKK